jgi:hypothetical protein
MLKTFLLRFLVSVLVFTTWFSFPSYARADLTTIHVKVEETKASGKNWDILEGAPDLAICVTHSLIGTLCLPDGDRVETISTAQCPNSYDCRFSVEIPDQTFKVSVVDVDLRQNDIIGIGHCRQNESCEVGQAAITKWQASPDRDRQRKALKSVHPFPVKSLPIANLIAAVVLFILRIARVR